MMWRGVIPSSPLLKLALYLPEMDQYDFLPISIILTDETQLMWYNLIIAPTSNMVKIMSQKAKAFTTQQSTYL